jgi:penicillin-binding protein 1C
MSRRLRLLIAAVALTVAATAVVLRIFPSAPLSSFAPTSTAVYAEDGQLLRMTMASDQQYRLWTPLHSVSPEFMDALILHEDRHFYRHLGVDPTALIRACIRMATGGHHQGASTITMQLARLIYRLNTRTVTGKLHQMAAASWIELHYSKEEILEAHINLIPYGRNIQGVGAASLIYFGKPASRLTFAEALSLVLIPQSPKARDPKGDEPESLRSARIGLAHVWVSQHATAAASLAAAEQPLRFRRLEELPFIAPHLVTDLIGASGGKSEIHTTINVDLQRQLDRSVKQFIATQRPLGVTNAAVMLVDSRSMDVKALVGSADFADSAIDGQVNGTTAKRSPGSTLKPFIYALAMDQGLIHTQSVLKDAPTFFGAYAPENFDGAFVGPISAHDALIASRNVPAVSLSSRLAQPSLYQFLKNAGIARMASEQHYGLALALGGGEVTMEELVSLYAMLGNKGLLSPLHYVEGQAMGTPVRLLSEDAAFMVLSILRDNPRPDGLPNTAPQVAWKTGTSWGFRDAWAVGLVGPYVLAVWIGNFDGAGNPAFVGIQTAAPLFFRVVDGIRETAPRLPQDSYYPPPGVASVEVCAASGDLPNADCPHQVRAWFIPGKSPIRVSSVHRRIPIDTRTGWMACADTPAQYMTSQVFEYWPSDILHLYALAGMPRRPLPVDHCGIAASSTASIGPTIVFPATGATYQLHATRMGTESLQLTATAGSEIGRLYWFADGAFVGTSQPSSELAWAPTRPGKISVSVVDDHGGSASRDIRVALIQ